MRKRIIYISVLLIVILGAFVWITITFFPEVLVSFMVTQQIKRAISISEKSNAILSDTESIWVCTVGTASPFPGERMQTSTAVIVNGHFFMFDAGDGIVQKAEVLGLPLNRLDGIFITHWHSDHMIDLPSLISRSWLLGRQNDLYLYGPEGTDTLNKAINQFLHIENQHRVDHHGSQTMDIKKAKAIAQEFKVEQGKTKIAFKKDGITITAFDVDHSPIEPAVGYAIEYKGKKVVISGDTKKSDMVIEMAKNADLLLHEVILTSLMKQLEVKLKDANMNRNMKIVHDIQEYHTTPAEVAEIASKAKVKKLILHHFAPSPDFIVVKNLYKKELKAYNGEIHFANDGDIFIIK